jgi:hypothetical protein
MIFGVRFLRVAIAEQLPLGGSLGFLGHKVYTSAPHNAAVAGDHLLLIYFGTPEYWSRAASTRRFPPLKHKAALLFSSTSEEK